MSLLAHVRTAGRAALAPQLRELRRRAALFAAALAAGALGCAFLALAAYRALAHVWRAELAAGALGLALLALAALALAWSRRRARASLAPEAGESAAALGQTLASLVRRAELDPTSLTSASLLAGFALGSRRRERTGGPR